MCLTAKIEKVMLNLQVLNSTSHVNMSHYSNVTQSIIWGGTGISLIDAPSSSLSSGVVIVSSEKPTSSST